MDGPNRKQRRAMAAAERRSARSQPRRTSPQKKQEKQEKTAIPRKGDILTFEWNGIVLALRCTEANWRPGILDARFMPLEDTIHPVSLPFPAPLTKFATDGGKAINHHWEKLDYVFALPNPADFPVLPLAAEDRELIEYFIRTCRELAGYSAINDNHGLLVTSDGTNWKVEAHLPTKETFAGTAVAFRQLHSGQEEASFDKIKGRLFRAIKGLPEEDRAAAHAVVTGWARARADLMNQTLNTLVSRKVSNATQDDPVSFHGVVPDELIATYNYGGTIHFGKHRQALVDLTEDPTLAAYYSYACMESIAGLSHLYFGFAELLEAALGMRSRAHVAGSATVEA
ncbi:hypothetical protein [Nocardia farcinica]|uniref:hypothetical protein n=1 Tax=Nocardia farcinica TaxID=37329 RepID=UPI0024539A31|nr:hypothetical protein [Nocardia farcinica]